MKPRDVRVQKATLVVPSARLGMSKGLGVSMGFEAEIELMGSLFFKKHIRKAHVLEDIFHSKGLIFSQKIAWTQGICSQDVRGSRSGSI